MEIDYQDYGAIARLTVKSSIIRLQKHKRLLDTALLVADVVEHTTGVLVIRSVLTGKTLAVMRAYKAVLREASR